jgi:DnaK suppressor protein
MMTLDEGHVRTRLEEERVRLQQIRSTLAGGPPDGTPGERILDEPNVAVHDEAEQGTAIFERERDESILRHVDMQLDDVDHAVERLALGTYGICEACGRPMDSDRLLARPAARFCVEDQRRARRGVP